jgi:hypothetical protein
VTDRRKIKRDHIPMQINQFTQQQCILEREFVTGMFEMSSDRLPEGEALKELEERQES